MTFSEYFDMMHDLASAPAVSRMDDTVVLPHLQHSALNYQRVTRILRTYVVSDELRRAVTAIAEPQRWLILTEPWCGDSAQVLPYIAGIAACNPLITPDLQLRDKHLDLMDAYLTNGARSIPKLIAFGPGDEEIFRWGPRPAEAQDIFVRARAEGVPKDKILERVHQFYAKNRGQALEREFLVLLQ